MKPQIPNIIFKSLLWLKEHWQETEYKYILECYTLTQEQRQLVDSINQEQIYGTFEGKPEGKHG